MDIGLVLAFYAIKLLSLIFINLLVTFFVLQRFNAPASNRPYVATPMDTPDTPNSIPSDPNLNLSLAVSNAESMLSESSANDSLGGRPVTPDLISSGSTSESSSSSNTSYGHTTFEDSASQNTPPIVISPPRHEQMIDGSTPSPSVIDRLPQRQRTSIAERLLSLVDSDGRPIRLFKRSALKDITNITKPLSSVPGDDECIEDDQCLIYRSAEDFLPTFVSTPPTCNAPYSDSGFLGSSSSRFGDMFSPNALPSNNTPTFNLPESFKLSNFTGSMTRITGDIVTSLAAKYQNEDQDEDDVVDEQFEWEDEMRSLELRLGFYDKKM